MSIRIGINGFGRMGRSALRAGWGRPDLEFVHVNEVAGGAATAAHLLTFDSVHGRWPRHVEVDDVTASRSTARASPSRTPRRRQRRRGRRIGVDIVLECSGKFRTPERLDAVLRRAA